MKAWFLVVWRIGTGAEVESQVAEAETEAEVVDRVTLGYRRSTSIKSVSCLRLLGLGANSDYCLSWNPR